MNRHNLAIARLIAEGYRTRRFNAAFRCMMFCHWWAEGEPFNAPAIAASIMSSTQVDHLRLDGVLGLSREEIVGEWSAFMDSVGQEIRRVRVIPDAWRVTAPEPNRLLMTAVEVIHTSHVTEAKRVLYDDLRWMASEDAEFELEVLAA